MTTVELIYFRECPNISLARERLLQAFAAAGVTPQWQEWERHDPAIPGHARAYGSPTILINGRDVTGMEPSSDHTVSCRVYSSASSATDGAPNIDTIAAALRNLHKTAPRRAGWRSSVASLPAIGAAALPKLTCPACWPVYSGLLSSIGVSFVNYTPYLFPLTATFLLLSLIALGWKAPQRRGYGPLWLGLAASAGLLAGKFVFDSDTAMYAGMAVLVATSIWNAWPRDQCETAENCPACVSTVTK